MSETNKRLYLAIDDLGGFIRYMAGVESVVGGHWFLNRDDLESEAYLLLLDLVNRYKSKNYEDFLKLCKRSIANKFKSFKGKYLKSSRKHDHYAISFDDSLIMYDTDLIPFSDIIGFSGPYLMVTDAMSDNLYTSSCDPAANEVFELYEHLTDFDCAILDCLLGKNNHVPAYLHLVMLRSEFTGSQKPIRINEYIISRALCSSKTDVKDGFSRIKQVIMERNTNG